jgi:exopolysaccharide biosynthesis protein
VRHLHAIVFVLAFAPGSLAAADDWQSVSPGIDYQQIDRDGADAHVVRVNLTEPQLQVIATSESERGLTVSEFASRNGAIVAINGDYFDPELRPIGLAMGDGHVWAQASESIRRQEVVGVGDRRVQIFARAEPLRAPEPWMTGAVSGWPMVVDDCEPVAELPGSDHFSRAPHPRSAVGLSADRKQLFLVVADGRREGVPGLTLPELANLLDELGACTALNLDGGGSSAMWVRDRIVNQPSDLVERPVANHLAVIAASAPPDPQPGPESTPPRDD